MEWTASLGADNRLTGVRVLGVRLMDDCTLLVAGNEEHREALHRVCDGYMTDCYPEGMTVELTSDSLEWLFCGMHLTVSGRGVSARVTMKNVEAGVRTGDQLMFYPLVSATSDCGHVQKVASLLNNLYRIERHCSDDWLKAAAVVDLRREMVWQGYTGKWMREALVRMVGRCPFGFWNRLHRSTERREVTW